MLWVCPSCLTEVNALKRCPLFDGSPTYRGAFSGVFGYSCHGTIENVNKTDLYLCFLVPAWHK